MPQYLRNDSLRLLESSMESLALALTGLGMPTRRALRDPVSQNAPAIGLIGVAAEQAMSAVLVQTFGQEIVKRPSGHYKAFREILGDMRSLLRNPVPRAGFLTVGMPDPKAHREALLEHTNFFTVLGTERANGLHAGKGPSRDVAYYAAQRVYEFLKTLSASTRMRAYLESLPVPPAPPISTSVLIEDLFQRLAKSKGVQERAALIGSVFLVLPEIPGDEPDWVEALDRVAIAPDEKDLALLVTTLERAVPAQIKRVSATSGEALKVVVRQQDPGAMPIAPFNLRRQLTEICDQFVADVGTANGRLQSGLLDLPPDDFLRELFCLGPEGIRKALNCQGLTAQDVWPFVMTALRTHGTQGPFWFLAKMTDDHGQVMAHVKRAMGLLRGDAQKKHHETFRECMTAIQRGKPLSAKSEFAASIIRMMKEADEKRAKLDTVVTRNGSGPLGLSKHGAETVQRIQIGLTDLGDGLADVLDSVIKDSGKPYWARLMCEAASEPIDLKACVAVLGNDDLKPAHTAARKAIHLIDITTFGPQMEMGPE